MSRLDLLLVNPPSRTAVYQNLSKFAAIEPPVWAGLIARYMLNRGYSVEILDAEALGLVPMNTASEIMSRNPRLAAFCIYGHQPSASTQCMPGALETLEFMNAISEDFMTDSVPTLALGTHPSALPQRTLDEGFDFVVQGEGPFTLDLLLQNMTQRGDFRENHVTSIPGLWRKGALPGWRCPNVEALDETLPKQAWELLDMRLYRPHHWHKWTSKPSDKGKTYASVQTSLGCPFKCSFCCINTPFGGSGYRTWSAKNVADQIYSLIDDYGITNIKIPDEMFVLNKKHVREVCTEIIKMDVAQYLNMWCYGRIDTVNDPELLAHMRQAGFKWLGIGIESASSYVRDGVEKGRFGNEDIIKSVRQVQAAGLHIGANYIFGLPDDTAETIQQTLDLALEINAEYSNFYCAMAYPGSPLHARAWEIGQFLPEDLEGPGWIGYSQHSYESRPLDTDHLDYHEILDFRDEAWMKYHNRVSYLNMLHEKFGVQAVTDMNEIIAQGKPLEFHIHSDLPGRSGLGGSSSCTVGLVNALSLHFVGADPIDPWELAEKATHIEMEIIKEAVGCQDQIFAAHGGLQYITFERNQTKLHRLQIRGQRLAELEANLLLVFTGTMRDSHVMAQKTIKSLMESKEGFELMKEIAYRGLTILEEDWGNLHQIGHLLNEAWIHKKRQHREITNPQIDALYEKGRELGAIGGKLCGAGGGGYLLFYIPWENQPEFLCNIGAPVVRFKINHTGSEVIVND